MKRMMVGLTASLALSVWSCAGAADGVECGKSRECLAEVLETYLQALVKHDPSALPTTRNVKSSENGVSLSLGEGLWQTAAALPTYRLELIDEEAGQVGLLGRISENGNNNWYAVRLKVESDRKVSQIETLVNRTISGPASGGPPAGTKPAPTDPHPLMAQVIPENRRATRAELARIGNSYFSGLDEDDSGRNVPFSPECQRRENGTTLANNPEAPQGSMQSLGCKEQFDTGFSVIVTDIRERRFEVVDRTKGLAFGWGYFDHNGTPAKMSRTLDHQLVDVPPMFRQPFSFYIAEVFKIVDGKIRQIEAVLTAVPFQMESGWPSQAMPPSCTRQSLQAAADSYLAAQKAGDPSKMALAPKAKYLENMIEVDAGRGLWNTALPVSLSRSFLDKDRCRTFSEVIVTEGAHQYVIGTRLTVDAGRITAIDSLVTDKGDWLFNANAYLKYSRAEDWSAPKAGARASMQELINAANSYLDQFSDKLVKTPWGRPCARLEGGAYTNRDNKPDASCEVGIPPGVLYIVNRDYVVDEEMGVVNVYCRFGNSTTGMPDAHTFRVVNGKITNVHTLSVNLNPDRPSPQSDDNGAIIR